MNTPQPSSTPRMKPPEQWDSEGVCYASTAKKIQDDARADLIPDAELARSISEALGLGRAIKDRLEVTRALDEHLDVAKKVRTERDQLETELNEAKSKIKIYETVNPHEVAMRALANGNIDLQSSLEQWKRVAGELAGLLKSWVSDESLVLKRSYNLAYNTHKSLAAFTSLNKEAKI